MGSVAESVAAKIRHLFGCARILRKSAEMEVVLTDVGCFEMQNAASANQSGSSTNHIGWFGGLLRPQPKTAKN